MKRFILALFCIFGFSLVFTQKSFALSDLVINWTVGDQGTNYVVCDNTDDNKPNCSDYSYFVVDTPSAAAFGYSSFQFTNISTGSIVNARVLDSLVTTFTLRNNIRKITVGSTGLSSMTLTFTDTLGDESEPCPEPEEPDPCPDPEENSRFIQVVLDAFWKYHTVFAGAVASLIAIFVVYRIIKGLLR